MSTKFMLKRLIASVSPDVLPDQRLQKSLERILTEVGEQAVQNLLQFAEATAVLQRKAADAGMKLAVAIFNEASYLEKHHRFDEDNQYGWKSKRLRKQAQQMIEAVGFKRNNAHKLVAAAEWLVSRPADQAEQEWFKTLTPSHLYELSRMSAEGLEVVKKEVSYADFLFSAGQQSIAVRRLEDIRRNYPKNAVQEMQKSALVQSSTGKEDMRIKLGPFGFDAKVCEDLAQGFHGLEADENHNESGTAKLVHQFVFLAQTINWLSIQEEADAMALLSSIEGTLSRISKILDEWNGTSLKCR